ncbi:MarR family winged helix-turn-helix transcriptional regulator [Streptomyces sp. NPDC002514]|uniref:MarR family winged helix-turn-helix transcriptional regulator n=1 Tax=unclassified Streptomyces TaxID=2593676 RepID=UPI0036D100E4
MEPSKTTDTTPLDDLYAALATLAYTMTGNRAHARLRRQAGVPVDRASLAVLRVLAASPSPLRLGELADALMVKAPHITREVRRLEEQGLVATVREPGDQRARLAEATAEGREAVVRIQAAGEQWLAEALKDFSGEELRSAAAVIRTIADYVHTS